jgi:hypothetical protein
MFALYATLARVPRLTTERPLARKDSGSNQSSQSQTSSRSNLASGLFDSRISQKTALAWSPLCGQLSTILPPSTKALECDCNTPIQKNHSSESWSRTLRVSQRPSCTLRQIVRLEAVVEDVSSRSGAVCFHRTYGNDPSRLQQIQSTVTGTFGTHHSHTAYFRSFQETATNLPGHKLRSSDRSSVSVALEYDGIEKPVIPKEGQHVFAFLPVQQIRQLPVSPARHFNVLWLTITVPPSRGLCPDRKS